jgi:hypothetical protein
MIIAKEVILAELRKRGQNGRADFVDRQLPDEVDSAQHGGLLAMMHLDLDELAAAGQSSEVD